MLTLLTLLSGGVQSAPTPNMTKTPIGQNVEMSKRVASLLNASRVALKVALASPTRRPSLMMVTTSTEQAACIIVCVPRRFYER